MTTLIRIEIMKMRTTPALWVGFAVVTALTVMSGITTILLAGKNGTAPLGSASNVSHALAIGVATSITMLLLGIVISAGEDRHRTALGTYLAEPRRGRVLTAKLITGAIGGAVFGAGAYLADLAIIVPLYAAKGVHHLPVDIVALGAGTVLATMCFGVLGVALGALTRNTVASIIAALVWVGVVELVILQQAVPSIAKWLPTNANKAVTSMGQHITGMLSPPVAAAVLVAWGAALALVANQVTVRREVR